MEQKLRQRIVGVIVLTALAVIFLPLLFEDAVEKTPEFKLDIPEKPHDFESKVIELPEYPITTINSDSKTSNKQTAETSSKVTNSNKKTNEVAESLTAWVIQMASFSSQENAQEFRDKVRKAGYPAFVEPVENSQPVLYRVFVGPEIEKQSAEAMDKKLQSLFKVKTLLISYDGPT